MSLRRYTSTATDTTPQSAITATSTSITPTNQSGYPEAPFAIQIENEAIVVGEVSGSNWIGLERGFDGSVPVAHSTSATIQHVALGDDFRNRWLDTLTIRPWGTLDDEFDGDTMDSAWTAISPSGTSTWTQSNGVMSVWGENVSSEDMPSLVKSFPVLPPYQVTTAIRMVGQQTSYHMAGLIFTDGVTSASNAVACFVYNSATDGDWNFSFRAGTVTNISATSSETFGLNHLGPQVHLRLTWRAINLFRAEISSDGVSWTTVDLSDVFTTFTPTHAGLTWSSWGAADPKVTTFDYFRGESL